MILNEQVVCTRIYTWSLQAVWNGHTCLCQYIVLQLKVVIILKEVGRAVGRSGLNRNCTVTVADSRVEGRRAIATVRRTRGWNGIHTSVVNVYWKAPVASAAYNCNNICFWMSKNVTEWAEVLVKRLWQTANTIKRRRVWMSVVWAYN